MTIWRKKGLLVCLVFLSVFPFILIYISVEQDFLSEIWSLRHFLGMALFQAFAQIALGLYIFKNKVPNYAIYCVVSMALFSQVTFGIAVALVSNA